MRVHVHPALEPQGQFLLPRLYLHPGPQRLVLEPPRHVHDDLAPGQPPLALAVDVRIGDLSQPEVPADVDVPGVQVGVDLVVVAVGLVGNAFGRAEMDPAGNRPSRVVVEDGDVYPVPPPVQELHAHARRLDHLLPLHVTPFYLANGLLALFHRHRRGRDGRHFDVGRARLRVLRLTPASEIVVDEVIGRRFGQGMDVGGDAPVHVHAQVEGLFGVVGIGQRKARLAFALADEGMLVDLRDRQSGDDERRTGRNDLQRFDLAIGMGVPPGPEVVSPGIVTGDFRLTPAHVAPIPLVTPHLQLTPVREGEKRLAAQGDMADFKTLADGYANFLAPCQPEHIVRHGNPQRSAFHQVGFQQAMGQDQAGTGLMYGNGHTA